MEGPTDGAWGGQVCICFANLVPVLGQCHPRCTVACLLPSPIPNIATLQGPAQALPSPEHLYQQHDPCQWHHKALWLSLLFII